MAITVRFLVLEVVVLILVAAIVGGVFGRFRSAPSSSRDGGRPLLAVAWDAERIFIYALSFAGLMAMIYAIAGLLATVVVEITQHSSALIGSSDARDHTSYYLASIVVGTPIWLGLWTLVQRRASRSPLEKQARERRWYLAAIFAVTSVVALFGLHSLAEDFLTLPGAFDKTQTVRDGIFAGGRLLIWGGAWLAVARLGWSERTPRDRDEAHDVAVYVLSGFALAFLAAGLIQTGYHLLDDIIAATPPFDGDRSLWRDWGSIGAWVVAGGLTWALIWRYDLERGGRRVLRVFYVYAVLAVAGPATLIIGVTCLNEIVKRIFGYSTEHSWLFLRDVLPVVLVAGAVWAYHWTVMRNQPAPSADADIKRGAIPWPRHPAIAILDLVGLAMTVAVAVVLVWLALDALFKTGMYGSGAWWRNPLSLGIALGLAGTVTWIPAWSILQRSAVADPERERRIEIRYRLLGLITLSSVLIAVGFTVALVWTVFRALLNGSAHADTGSWVLKDLSVAVLMLGVAAYHAVFLRRERRLQVGRPKTIRLLALLAPGGESTLAELSRGRGRTIEVLGRLDGVPTGNIVDPQGLERALATFEAEGKADGVLLMVSPTGVSLSPYAKVVPAELAGSDMVSGATPRIGVATSEGAARRA